MRPVVVKRHFFKLQGRVGVQYLDVVRTKCGRLSWRKQIRICPTYNVLAGEMKDVFELPIHQQIAPRCILEKDQGRTVIENRLEARFALAEFRRDTVTIGHVLNLRNEIEG